MDEVLQIKKGSSGYSAPGPSGTPGDSGKSSHFSSIPLDSSLETIKEHIENNQSLSNNEICIKYEFFEEGDIIIDLYGNLGMILSKNPIDVYLYGNIIYNNTQTEDNIYHAPVNESGEATLTFKIDNQKKLYPTDGYCLHNKSMKGTSTLWTHRWKPDYAGTSSPSAPGYMLTPSNNDVMTYCGEKMSSLEFINKILSEEKYCKICVLFKNGLSYETPKNRICYDLITGTSTKEPPRVYIFDGYFNMIDIEVSKLQKFDSFSEEQSTEDTDGAYKKFIIGGDSTYPKLCDIYFEYTHEGKTYRMNVNVTE